MRGTSTTAVGLQALLLILAAALLYGGALDTPFIYDDRGAILGNPALEQLWPPTQAMAVRDESPLAGRPLVAWSFALNHAVSGYDTWSYHLINLVMHAGAALLVWALVRRTLRLLPWPGDAPGADWLAFGAALLWAVHPLNIDAVQYVTQRTELMVALCYLGTLLCFIRAQDSAHRLAWLAGSAGLCALGMLSKEVMVSAPLFVWLYDRQFFAGTFRAALIERPWFYAALAATWVPLIALLMMGPRSESVGFHHDVSAWEYLLTQSRVLMWYLRLVVWPAPLSIAHEWPLVEHWTDALLTGPVILALLALTVYGLVRARPWHLLGAWCFMILAPSSSFVPIVTEVAAERRMYLPLAALVAAAVCALAWLLHRAASRLSRQLSSRRLALIGASALIVLTGALAARSLDRLSTFHSRLALWREAAALYPRSGEVLSMVGLAQRHRGELERATRTLSRAMRVDPHFPGAIYNYASVMVARQRYGEARRVLEDLLELQPDRARNHAALGKVLIYEGRAAAAVPHMRRAAELRPHVAQRHVEWAVALREAGRQTAAIERLEHALALAPEHAIAHRLLRQLRGRTSAEPPDAR